MKASNTISIFLPSLRGGGAEKAMLIFAGEAASRGLPVDLIVASGTGALASTVPEGVRLIDLQQKRVSGAFLPLVRYLRKTRPAALYATISHANVLALLASILSCTGTPVIVRESNVPVTEPRKSLTAKIVFRLMPLIYPRAHAIIAVSEGVAAELEALSTRLSGRVTVVPTPVISADHALKASQSVEHPWFGEGQPPVILGCARLQPHKGFALLMNAVAEIRKHRDVRLIILGEGPEKENLLSLARNLNIESHVALPGFVQNPFSYMKQAKVFVLASEYEGMPNTLIQAIACGTAVVSTNCKSGPAEILEDGKLGELVEVGNLGQMKDAIIRALKEGARQGALESVEKRFGVKNSVTGYLELAGIRDCNENCA